MLIEYSLSSSSLNWFLYKSTKVYDKTYRNVIKLNTTLSWLWGNEIFDEGFFYLLVGTVGGTKNETEVQEF